MLDRGCPHPLVGGKGVTTCNLVTKDNQLTALAETAQEIARVRIAIIVDNTQPHWTRRGSEYRFGSAFRVGRSIMPTNDTIDRRRTYFQWGWCRRRRPEGESKVKGGPVQSGHGRLALPSVAQRGETARRRDSENASDKMQTSPHSSAVTLDEMHRQPRTHRGAA